ncbi:hypothetical protein ACFLX2_01100 [Candidatus Dependentiae bacterium]
MEMVNRLRLALEGLDRKDFYKYLMIVLGVIVLLMGIVVFRHYRKVNDLTADIDRVNAVREDDVSVILRRMETVKNQRDQVNDILARERDFKIAGYFNELLSEQNLVDKKTEESTSVADLGDYREFILNARFDKMKMQQLCELLDEIEKKERVYAKSLEIIRSTKSPRTIEVNLTIATLQPKAGR